jgi:uncharacterized protein YjbI with pentapeptide repeats
VANEKLLKLVGQGRGAFVKWRAKHPKVILDLMDADLAGIDLRGANLRRADLIGVNLIGANLATAALIGADLTRSKLCQIKLQRADLSNALLAFADLSGADLTGANLSGADLSKTTLTGAILTEAKLDGARLSDANLQQAKLSGASLKNADLSNAQLNGVDLSSADLTESNLNAARLDETDLTDANLNRANVKSAQFHECRMGWTSLGGIDFSGAFGLDSIIHLAPNSLGIDSLLQSQGKLPEPFLRGCGVPADWANTVVNPAQRPVNFLVFSEQDRPIAEVLQKSLAEVGVRCWLHSKPMEKQEGVPSLFERRADLWDKFLLCASSNSLRSWWVDDEIGAALEREDALTEQRGKPTEVLVPVIIDGFIQGGNWEGVHNKRVYDRLSIDFSRCRRDKARFAAEIEKIVQAVQGEDDQAKGKKKKGK